MFVICQLDTLSWFGHVEYEDDISWIEHCATMEVGRTSDVKTAFSP